MGSPGHNATYPKAGDTDSAHCSRLMLVVSLSHSISGEAMAGQIRTVVSPLAEARRCPSGLNATPYTAPVWPVRGAPRGWPVSAFHTRTVVSPLAEARRCPSGLN